jgi:hypothetical protein
MIVCEICEFFVETNFYIFMKLMRSNSFRLLWLVVIGFLCFFAAAAPISAKAKGGAATPPPVDTRKLIASVDAAESTVAIIKHARQIDSHVQDRRPDGR